MKSSHFKRIDYKIKNNQSLNVEDKSLKTTNINILLNRVRIERKNSTKKKIFFFISIISILSLIGIVVLGN